MFGKQRSSSTTGKTHKLAKDVPVRKSDRKSLRKRAQEVLGTDDEQLDSIFMQGNLLARLIAQPDGKTTLYFRNEEEDSKLLWCVWIRVDSVSRFDTKDPVDFPSVPLLARLSTNILPTVHVHPAVSEFLCRGADLMRPGMRTWKDPTSPAAQDRVVAIQVQGNPHALAVGYLAEELKERGVGVTIITCYGDDLWKDNPYHLPGFMDGKFVMALEDSEENVATQDEEVPVEDVSTDIKPEDECGESTGIEESVPGNEAAANVDDQFHEAVCRALVRLTKKDLPIRIAAFYSQFVKPHTDIAVKETTFKKFGNYVGQHLELLHVKPDPTNPTDKLAVLVGFDRKDDTVRNCAASYKEDTPQEESGKTKLVVSDLYCLPQQFEALLKIDRSVVKAETAASEMRRGTGMLTPKEATAILDDYITRESLVDESDQIFIVLDASLTDALYGSKNRTDAPDRLSRKDVNTKWKERMQPAFVLVQMPGSKVIKIGRGNPPKITLEVKRRQQRKYVTHMTGFVEFGLDGEELRSEVSHRFGLAGSSESKNELLFQGSVAEQLEALLTGDERLTSHGGAKGSPYALPRNAIVPIYRKGVPVPKNHAKRKK